MRQRTTRGWRAAMLGRIGTGLAALCALVATPAAAQTMASAESQVLLQEPLSVYAVQDMDFGQIVTDGSQGTVTIDPETQTCTATASLVRTGPCRTANFSGYARRFWIFSFIRVDVADTVELTGPGGATMTVDQINFASDTAMARFGDRLMLFDDNDLFEIRVGGTLHVEPDQKAGVYTGTLPLSIVYD